ncbi:MAG: DUF4395 family protein [Actinobacteria bacterium]|jgi:hypothetical protein|uniref:Unannotated protein n=1 Tax=freshwater metagenome TaxID=449393 RepID=A0A6J6ECJ2_9ZZZZ|nr:DUF4395 family protein [Actinomycetota bacterium]
MVQDTNALSQKLNTQQAPTIIDARGPRFGAVITSIVLATALATNNVWVIVAQAVVFAIGAIKGPQFTPYAFIFKNLVKPRLKKAGATEDVRPPQFAQTVGLLFALTAAAGSFAGLDAVFTIAVAFALAAAFLNAAFNFCLGCEIYLLLLRARSK